MSWFSLTVENKTKENKHQWSGKGDGEILHAWFLQLLFWLSGMEIFVMWGIVTYQQYFSGFFQFSFPEISGFKRKAASANTALVAALPVPLEGLVSLLGASHTWPFLYEVALKKHRWPQNSTVHATAHPRFTAQSFFGCANLERAARGDSGDWGGRGDGARGDGPRRDSGTAREAERGSITPIFYPPFPRGRGDVLLVSQI